MSRPLSLALLLALAGPLAAQQSRPTPLQRRYQAAADRLIDAALADSAAWTKLAELADRFGPRLSGSANLEHAIDWVVERMKAEGLDDVRTEPVMVPHWVRGRESAEMVQPRYGALPMLGLGGSVGTPPGGITAEVLVVSSFDDLKSRAAEARDRIVLFDVPFTNYGQTVQYRGNGAIEAAKLGAVASMIRSVGPFGMRTPHTGAMRYDESVPKIPGFAITMEDAAMLHRIQDRGDRIVVTVAMEARTLPDAPSRNVLAEIRGSERPDEVVVIGGHIDSWDVGTGAMDDGGGVIIAWEAVRLMHRLGLRPRRTVRVVAWTNEENGGRGGQAYRDAHQSELRQHVLAIESDGGVFRPIGFGFTGPDSPAGGGPPGSRTAHADRRGLDPLVGRRRRDIGPIMREGVPGMSHVVDESRYFWYHHTPADNVDKLDPREVAMNTAAMAVMAYVMADR